MAAGAWGILALAIGYELPAWMVLFLGTILFGLAFLVQQTRRALIALSGVALLLSGVSFSLQTELNKPLWIQEVIKQADSHELELEILNRPKQLFEGFEGEPSFGVAVELRKLDGKYASARGYLIYQEQPLERGQTIDTIAQLREPGRSSRDSFSVRAEAEISVLSDASTGQSFLNNLRGRYVASLSGVTPDAKVLVGGLAIGETSGLSGELAKAMLTVSLTHLVAVSGSNCAIVVGMVYLIAVWLRFGRAGRTIFSLSALVGYVLLIGPDPSVLRAAVMSASVIIVIALGRRTNAFNALAIAALILLIADPWLAVEFGFGLSVAATAGILLLAPAIYEKLARKMPKALALGLAVTLAAQLFCLPLIMQLQPGLPTYSVMANLLAGPVVAPVTVLGMIAVLVSPLAPWLTGSITWLASLGTWLIEQIAHTFSNLPVASFPWLTGIPAALLSIFLIIATSAWLRSDWLALRQVGVASVVVVAVVTVSVPAASEVLPQNWPSSDWQVVACDVGQGDSLVIKSQGRIAVVDVGREPALIDSCLSDLGISTIDLLVLTHFDFDHVGGLSGLVQGREVNAALLSGFPDDRPATQVSKELLADANAKIVVADPTVSGTLGSFSWQVLSPSREAKEASDSNDASVVLLFRSQDLDLLLLGDLGERGQKRIESKVVAQLKSANRPLILKVSHHGSNDQSDSFHQNIRADVGIVSVGQDNGYGHPGKLALDMLSRSGTRALRTDQLGSIAISVSDEKLYWSATG